MDLAEKAQELSKKYNTDYITTKEFLTNIFIDEIIAHPLRALFRTHKLYDKTYTKAEETINYRQTQIAKGEIKELIPVYDFWE